MKGSSQKLGSKPSSVFHWTLKKEILLLPMMMVMLLLMMLLKMMMMIMVVEFRGRLDGQASDWRTGSDQEVLPPQHIDPSWNQNSSIYCKVDFENASKTFHVQKILNLLESAIPPASAAVLLVTKYSVFLKHGQLDFYKASDSISDHLTFNISDFLMGGGCGSHR